MINSKTYESLAGSLALAGEDVVLQVGDSLKKLHMSAIKNPDNVIAAGKAFDSRVNMTLSAWNKKWQAWAGDDLAEAYLRGAAHADGEIELLNLPKGEGTITEGTMLAGKEATLAIPRGIPNNVKSAFSSAGLKHHLTFYNTFRNAAFSTFEKTNFQILRAAHDLHRDVAVMAGEATFKESDIFTRRALSQKMLDDYARRGLTSVVYKNGAHVSVDSYAEMVGRTMSGHAAMQASLNRYAEYGYDLVRITSHFTTCELCAPWEGKILRTGTKQSIRKDRVAGASSTTMGSSTPPLAMPKASDRTLLDAEKYLQSQLQRPADYTSIPGMDIQTADEINNALITFNQQHPGVKNLIGKVKMVPANEINGAAYFDFDMQEIRLNADYFGKGFDHVVQRHLTDIEYKLHPKGTTWTSVIHHEATHAMLRDVERVHGAGIFKTIKRDSLKQAGMKIGDISENLSSYAATDPEEFIAEEFIAEAFGEFHTSAAPRTLSKTIVQTVEKYLRKGRGGH